MKPYSLKYCNSTALMQYMCTEDLIPGLLKKKSIIKVASFRVDACFIKSRMWSSTELTSELHSLSLIMRPTQTLTLFFDSHHWGKAKKRDWLLIWELCLSSSRAFHTVNQDSYSASSPNLLLVSSYAVFKRQSAGHVLRVMSTVDHVLQVFLPVVHMLPPLLPSLLGSSSKYQYVVLRKLVL